MPTTDMFLKPPRASREYYDIASGSNRGRDSSVSPAFRNLTPDRPRSSLEVTNSMGYTPPPAAVLSAHARSKRSSVPDFYLYNRPALPSDEDAPEAKDESAPEINKRPPNPKRASAPILLSYTQHIQSIQEDHISIFNHPSIHENPNKPYNLTRPPSRRSPSSLSNTITIPYTQPRLSKARKFLMLFLFCFAEFMDSFIASALYPAIRVMEEDLGVVAAQISWAFAAYSATFAAFLLISGRLSDVYNAKWSFIIGAVVLASFSLGCGFATEKITMFILRALAGVGAAMTVPSALSLIIEWFPEPAEQAQGIALFGGCGAAGNVLGVVIGGMFVQWTSWRWIFWFTSILGFTIAILSVIVVPPSAPRARKPSWRRLDLVGVSLMTSAVVVFVYGVTSGSIDKWISVEVLVPLGVALVLVVAFFVYEAMIDPELAALPPRVWKYKNVPILTAIGFLPFLWWGSLFFQLMPQMQEQYGWSPIITSLHFLPTGVCSMLIATFVPRFVNFASPKWAIMTGLIMEMIATALLPFASTPERYYSFLIPALIIGTIGTTIVYSGSNIAIFMNTPPEMAGVIGAVFNAALQLGVALGLAVLSTITTSVQKSIPTGDSPYRGIAVGYWSILGLVGFFALLVLVCYRRDQVDGTSEIFEKVEVISLEKSKGSQSIRASLSADSRRSAIVTIVLPMQV